MKNFLVISGSVAMVFFIILLVVVTSMIRRISSWLKGVEKMSSQVQALSNVPLQRLDRWLQEKQPK